MKEDIYETITNQIIEELEKGVAPWVNDFEAPNTLPHNCVTGREYSGINILILWSAKQRHSYASDCWMTFKQAKSYDLNVRKGEKGTKICFVKTIHKKSEDKNSDSCSEDSDNDKNIIPIMKTYTVFNLDQLDGEQDKLDSLKPAKIETHEKGFLSYDEVIYFASKVGAKISFNGDVPCYYPKLDEVSMPPIETCFSHKLSKSEAEAIYYATALHEFTHWTGHKSRLDRDLGERFDKNAYAAEELVAELGASFLCAHFGIKGNLQHVNYIASWLEVLKGDKRAIFHASSKAQQATTYLLERHEGSLIEFKKAA